MTETRPNNKKKGKKSTVFCFDIENGDLTLILDSYAKRGLWLQHLYIDLQFNLGRRVGDILKLKWNDFFEPESGNFRYYLQIQEEKTKKLANIFINSACKEAIKQYVEKTGCDVTKDNYSAYVFLQLSGTHKGKILSVSGCEKLLKNTAKDIAKKNINTHSVRKTLGMVSVKTHRNDESRMEVLQTLFNHSSTKITSRYIGKEQEDVDKYLEDAGNFYTNHILNHNKADLNKNETKFPVNIDINDLRKIILSAYEAGKNSIHTSDFVAQSEIIDGLLENAVSLSI